eukprot:6190521-Amphidinium_carterae.5
MGSGRPCTASQMAMWPHGREGRGAARDFRVFGCTVDPNGRRYITEELALQKWRLPDKGAWSFLQGPSLIPELFEALRSAGKMLTQHDMGWRAKSGVPERGVYAKFNTVMAELLRLMVTNDQYNLYRSHSGEYAARQMMMLESAAARNPKVPDVEGLDLMVAGKTNTQGGIEATGFNQWLTGVQRDQSLVMKQGRLLREERAAEQKRGNNSNNNYNNNSNYKGDSRNKGE